MVGGMPEDELPDEDVAKFRKWFNELPVSQQNFYKIPAFQNYRNSCEPAL
jgi:hypothetical protein